MHRSRLPLGEGRRGCCTAPGHEGELPSDADLRESCNLGYAAACGRLPAGRVADAVRFAVTQDAGSWIEVAWVLERAHRPAGSGALTYDTVRGAWKSEHPDARIQRMAVCYLEAYLLRRHPQTASAD